MAFTRAAALLVLALPLLGTGCKLVDQRTFNAQADMPPKPPPGPPGPGPIPPLVTVDFSKPDPQYAEMLRQAVSQALARKPDVQFDVITVVPGTGTTAEQVAAATAVVANAREVARSINSDGVDDDRIHLEARSDTAVTSRQVQVFIH